jgi:hypothetical protein
MNSVAIDSAIRARLAELNSSRNSNDQDELGNLTANHLPSVADHLLWEEVADFAADMCNPMAAADGRPGRLYELSDAEIVSAEAWFNANKDWSEVMAAAYKNDMLFESVTNVWSSFVPGQTVTINGREILVAAIRYVGTAFPQ